MIYRELGKSGIEASGVALGAWAIGGWMWGGTNEKDAIRAIHASLEHGVTLIDTAPIYGYGVSEEIVGKALRGRRDQAVLATKCGMIWDREEGEFFFHADDKGIAPRPSEKKVYKCLRPASIRAELEQSLRRLGTDYVDLYQTHWPDATTPIADTVAILRQLKDEGKIRALGVSNIALADLKAYGPIDSDQEKYSMLDRNISNNGILAHCRENHIAVLAYSPLANGLLTGKLDPERQFAAGDLRRMNPRFSKESRKQIGAKLQQLEPIAQRHDASAAQLVIAWTLAQDGITCVLCGARNEAQAGENARAADISLSLEELQTMGELLSA